MNLRLNGQPHDDSVTVEDELQIFDMIVGTIYEKHPLRILNKKVPRVAYIWRIRDFIVEGLTIEESTQRVMKIVHEDYRRGLISYPQYYHCRKFFEKFLDVAKSIKQRMRQKQKQEDEQSVEPMEKLLLKYLLFLCSLDRVPESFRISELKRALGWEEDTIYKFIDWLMNSEYRVIVRHIRIAKENLKKNVGVVQK